MGLSRGREAPPIRARRNQKTKDKAKERARAKRWKDRNMIKISVNLNIGTNARDQAIAEWLESQPSKSEALKDAAYKALSEEK